MSGLLTIAGDGPPAAQVWFINYPGGQARRITNDLSTYRALALTTDSTKFSTIQANGLVNVWVAPAGDAAHAVQLPTGNVGFYGTAGNPVSWTPDGRIAYVSNEGGNADVWLMDADGKNRKQLTTNSGVNVSPVVSADGRFIVFASVRNGVKNIWRMDIDGSNPTKLTSGLVDSYPVISRDNKWVIYAALEGSKPTLWKVSARGGGAPAQLSDHPGTAPSISPDGKLMAYLYPDSPDPFAPPNRIAVMPLEGTQPLNTFSFQVSGTVATVSEWSTDGKSIIYSVNNNNVSNLWSQPLDGSGPKQITDFKGNLITGFAWSRDGKQLACTRGVLLRDAVLITEVKER
jgi:TolB protein